MAQYKLYYFYKLGYVAEPIRMLFHFVGQSFEDIRIKPENWQHENSVAKFYGSPVLEVDGKQLAQSTAILQYLGKKFGLAGRDDWEQAKAAEYLANQKDIYKELNVYLFIKSAELGECNLAEEFHNKDFNPGVEKYFPVLEKILVQSSSGFMLPSGLSYADFSLAHFLEEIKKIEGEVFAKYPKLLEYMDKFNALPQLKEYLAKRGKQ